MLIHKGGQTLKLSRSKKILLGILSIWPLVYFMLFFIFVIAISMLAHDKHDNMWILIIIPFHMLTGLINLELIIFYILHAIRTIKPTDDMRIIWVILILLGSVLANPIYWYLHIWKEQEKGETAPTPLA